MSSRAKADTWMPLYIGDYLADTMSLTTLQHGAYLLLMMHQWRNGPLPDDDEELAAIARCDLAVWKKSVGPKVRKFFGITPDGLSQKRLAAEKLIAESHTEKRALAGKAGASSRWKKGEAAAAAGGDLNGKRMANVCQTDGNAIGKRKANAQQSQVFANGPSPSPSPVEAASEHRDFKAGQKVEMIEGGKAPVICRSDAPHLWAVFAESWEVDDRMVKRPVAAGEYFDLLSNRVLDAAGVLDGNWRGDFSPIIDWLKSGRSGDVIVAAVRQVAARPGYTPPGSLKYFSNAVREYRGT